jgi:chromosome segregation ATPase
LTEDKRANLAQVIEEKSVAEAEDQMMDLQHAFMVYITPEVGNSLCSKKCSNKIKSYQEKIVLLNKQLEDKSKVHSEQVQNLTIRLEDYSYEIYQLKKGQRPLKEKCEAAVSDFERIAEENSINKAYLIFAKEDIAKLTAELEALKSKLKNTESNFKMLNLNLRNSMSQAL